MLTLAHVVVMVTSNGGSCGYRRHIRFYNMIKIRPPVAFSPIAIAISFSSHRIASGGGGPAGSILASDTGDIRPAISCYRGHTSYQHRDIHCAS